MPVSPTIAVIAPGAMGSAVGRRLAEHGARVLTVTEGRSEQTAARARAAGMVTVALADVAAAELILSIVPPAEAPGVASALAPVLMRAAAKPAFVDCNAIGPATMEQVAGVLAKTGCDVLDGAIIGPPPVTGSAGPRFYVAGDAQHRASALGELGLVVRTLDGPLGAAKSLKMVYAGINKGLTALGAAMLLAASRADCVDGLRRELSESLPEIFARLRRNIPDMYPKAYRWVAEMKEISAFLGPDDPTAPFFEAAAELYARIADDRAKHGELAKRLDGALGLDEASG